MAHKTSSKTATKAAPLGSAERTNQLLAQASKQTGIPVTQTFGSGGSSRVQDREQRQVEERVRDPRPDFNQTPTPGAIEGVDVDPEGKTLVDTKQPTPGGTPVGQERLPTFAEAQKALNEGGLQGQQLADAQNNLRNSNRFRAAHGNLAPGTQLTSGAGAGQIVGPAPEQQAPAPASPYDEIIKENPIMGGLMATLQDYMSESNQRTSLVQEYSALSKKLGIEELNVEAMNLKNIIEGTEDDIRLEVTKAGGFATDSQVIALTNSRNKQNIKNYNRLQDTIAAKEKTLSTLIGLEAQDRQAADQRFNNIFNMTAQIAQFQQQAIRDTKSDMQWTASQPGGFEALQQEYFSNPTSRGLMNKMFGGFEGLERMASIAKQDRDLKVQEQQLKLQSLRSGLYTDSLRQQGLLQDLQGQGTNEGRALELADKVEVLQRLSQHRGLNSAVGPTFLTRIGLLDKPTGAKADFIAGVEQIVDQQFLDKLISVKGQGATFGALSDNEGRALRQAATKIGTWRITDKNGKAKGYAVDQTSFKKELNTIQTMVQRALDQELGLTPAEIAEMNKLLGL